MEELLRKRRRFSAPVTGGKLLAAPIRKLARPSPKGLGLHEMPVQKSECGTAET
jgi:hypothetical protein